MLSENVRKPKISWHFQEVKNGMCKNLLIGTKYSRMDQVKFEKTAFKKFEGISHSSFLKAVFHKFY